MAICFHLLADLAILSSLGGDAGLDGSCLRVGILNHSLRTGWIGCNGSTKMEIIIFQDPGVVFGGVIGQCEFELWCRRLFASLVGGCSYSVDEVDRPGACFLDKRSWLGAICISDGSVVNNFCRSAKFGFRSSGLSGLATKAEIILVSGVCTFHQRPWFGQLVLFLSFPFDYSQRPRRTAESQQCNGNHSQGKDGGCSNVKSNNIMVDSRIVWSNTFNSASTKTCSGSRTSWIQNN